MPDGTRFVANMGELLTGWQRWEDNKPTDSVMGKVMERFQAPRRNELGDMDREQWEVDGTGKERDPWQRTNYLLMKGANDGELYTFTTSSKGGLDAVARLCKDYAPFMATEAQRVAGDRDRPRQLRPPEQGFRADQGADVQDRRLRAEGVVRAGSGRAASAW